MKTKRMIIEWIITSVILFLVLPFLYVHFTKDKEEMFDFFRIQILFINPIAIISLIISQIWRIKRANRVPRSEIL